MSDFLTQLRAESTKWKQANVIDAAQQKKILARYGKKIKQYEKVETTGKINSVLSILGAILLGMGIMLLVASNWQDIPNIYKVLLLVSSTIAAAGVGYYLHSWKQSYPKTGFALVLLSSLMMGASIFLIAQIYHVNAHSSSLLLLWLVSILPMAWIYASGILASLGVGLFTGWLPFMLIENYPQADIHFFALLWGMAALYYSIGLLSARKGYENFCITLKTWGVVGALFIMYLMSFDFIIEEIQLSAELFEHLPLAVVSLPVVAALLIELCREKKRLKEAGIVALTLAFAWSAQFFNPDATLVALVMNLTLLAGEIALISVGYRLKKAFVVYLGLAFFTLHVFTRYIDWFFDLLPRSLFFIVGGILFILVGLFLERQRKKIIAKL